MTTEIKSPPPLSTWRYWWELIKTHPGLYGATTFLRILIFSVMFQVAGLLEREFFNALTGDALLGWQPWVWALLVVGSAIFRSGLILTDMYMFFRWSFSSAAVMRKNMFEHILNQPGAKALPGSTGEAVSRFRGDAEEVGNFTAWALFILAQALFAIVAVIIMVRINARITFFVFMPLVGVVALANATMSRIQKYREAIRGATGSVTGFIGEMFDAAQAIKAATAEEKTLAHFKILNERRKESALKDRLFNEIMGSIFRNTVNLGTGAILLLGASSLQDGTFTIGDFALFVYYLWFVTDLTALTGIFFARFKQAGVSFERMAKLIEGAPPENLTRRTPVYLAGDFPTVPYTPKTADHQLVQDKLAAAALAIHTGNLLTWHCARVLETDGGRAARGYSSMAKLHCARMLCDVLDDAIQLHGARGYSEDMPFAQWYRHARAARIADGPDEVHVGVIAKDWLRGRVDLLI